jgi:acetylornithine deacetylase/succinyl-diaminopimelate desuccinylase-like protein
MSSTSNQPPIYQRPAELLQQLIRFDTTNPPGNEAECIAYINYLLAESGFETNILAHDPMRSNLVARLAGQGNVPPLLLYGHIDVVTTENQEWQHPPFEGIEADGYIWGRGALDMKGGVAMMLAAFLRAKAENLHLPGDVILTVVSDEEAGGDYGAKYLVENHADLFKNVRYALGEIGGFTTFIGGRKFYPIMVAEKRGCLVKATVRGPGGHASLPLHGGAMARLGNLLLQLDTQRLPVHITPVTQLMIETVAAILPDPINSVLQRLLDPAQTDVILDSLSSYGAFFDPILHNTVNATIVHGGEKSNVIPSKIVLEMDGRVLPGYTADDLLAELHQLAGDDVELDVRPAEPVSTRAAVAEPDMGLFDILSNILREADPGGIPMPYMLPAVTDGRFFSQLDIQTYGFLPMNLPEGFDFSRTIHAADERIPVVAMDFGTNAIYEALTRFGS